MVLFDGAFGLLMFGLWLFCIVDVITTPDGAVRNLPKLLWLLIVVILPAVGSIAWLVAGRNWSGSTRDNVLGARGPRRQPVGARRPTNPDDDEEFLATLRAQAEEQRRRAREAEGDDAAS